MVLNFGDYTVYKYTIIYCSSFIYDIDAVEKW